LDATNQQKILGYFIEEAREHLETLANGLMDLPKVIRDPEEINELFRAAHSVKGGSAMLGYNSIQRTAHRLEDCFKILKEHEVPADTRLETLFLKGYDTLHTLIDKLESPFGLQDDEAEQITAQAEPDFAELENYLHHMVAQGEGNSPAPLTGSESAIAPVASTNATSASHALTPAQAQLAHQCRSILKEMLALFKGTDSPTSRKELQRRCVRLAKLAMDTKPWQRLTKAAHQAIANPKHAYKTLGPVILQELKQGSDRLVLGAEAEITVSTELKQLAQAPVPQVLIPVEPQAAAKALSQVFDRKQLSQLAKLLVKS
jgi:type IV pili sensor histidine kinase/response regulator